MHYYLRGPSMWTPSDARLTQGGNLAVHAGSVRGAAGPTAAPALAFDSSFELVLSKHFNVKIYCGTGCLRNQSARKSARCRIFFGVSRPGAQTRESVNGNREVRKNFPQGARLEIIFNAVGRQDGDAQSL